MPLIHQTLELPHGYQHFDWYREGHNNSGLVFLNDPKLLRHTLKEKDQLQSELRLYTQHQIFYEDGILKHTRSSPNWNGGFVTYSTCKHLMRTYKQDWLDTWIVGLCPRDCCCNTILFAGRVSHQFESNYALSRYCRDYRNNRDTSYKDKLAILNPRGDIYTPSPLQLNIHQQLIHTYYFPPENHTRSVEFYKKSPGSKLPDGSIGPIPKWWRDIEYVHNGVRPPSFILAPCFIFSKPMLWTTYDPKRAALKLTAELFAKSLKAA